MLLCRFLQSALKWSGWGSFFSSLLGERGAVRAVRALNRQRIMEIKAERLANGNIMATDCLGQLGHANEVTIAGGGGGIDTYGQSAARRRPCISNAAHTHVVFSARTHTHTHRARA